MPKSDARADAAERRTRNADRTLGEILDAAELEFSRNGYSGARVDAIAEVTSTTKRMIYYYFGSKEDLYREVLSRAYAGIRGIAQELDLDGLSPLAALRELARVTYLHHIEHESFIRIVAIENVHHAEHLRHIEPAGIAAPVIELIHRALERGRGDGSIRDDITALDVHQLISAQAVFAVANRHTIAHLFGRNMAAPNESARFQHLLGDAVEGLVARRD